MAHKLDSGFDRHVNALFAAMVTAFAGQARCDAFDECDPCVDSLAHLSNRARSRYNIIGSDVAVFELPYELFTRKHF